jgi:gamma-glutamyltranspeptidase/glutathione hydrolase
MIAGRLCEAILTPPALIGQCGSTNSAWFIQPGKRPRITLSPTLLFRDNDNQPVMAISVAGSDQQDQAAIQVILNYVEFGMSPEQAFKAPRFSNLGSLSVPNTLPEAVQANLRARGHVVTVNRGGVGGVALIGIDPKTKQATAVGPAAGKIE